MDKALSVGRQTGELGCFNGFHGDESGLLK